MLNIFLRILSNQPMHTQVELFFEKVTILEKYPLYGKKVPELDDDNFREILIGRYRIIYEVLSLDEIGIVTVHHQSRLLKNNKVMRKIVRHRKKR